MATIDPAASISRPMLEPRIMTALITMTVVTGFVDAVSYLGLGHVFTANMTGNVVLMAFALAHASELSFLHSFVSLASFMGGAVIGGRLARTMKRSTRQRWLLFAGTMEAGMLFAAAFAAIHFDVKAQAPEARLYAMILLTAVAMGLRTATVRALGIPDITTTVLTTTVTELAADSPLAGGSSPRTGRRIASVLAMFGGAACGSLLLRYGLTTPLVIGGACILAATIGYAMTAKRSTAGVQTAE
jgi:uncharacterized membrane protein YoaK (UPF0700 family)